MQFDSIATIGDMRRHLAEMQSSWQKTEIADGDYLLFLSPPAKPGEMPYQVHVLSIIGRSKDSKGDYTLPLLGSCGLPYKSVLRGEIFFDGIRHQWWGGEHHSNADYQDGGDDGDSTPDDTPVTDAGGYLYYMKLADIALIAQAVNAAVANAIRLASGDGELHDDDGYVPFKVRVEE